MIHVGTRREELEVGLATPVCQGTTQVTCGGPGKALAGSRWCPHPPFCLQLCISDVSPLEDSNQTPRSQSKVRTSLASKRLSGHAHTSSGERSVHAEDTLAAAVAGAHRSGEERAELPKSR